MKIENRNCIDGGSEYEIRLYINAVSKVYLELKEHCTRFENTKKSFLQRCGYDACAFDTNAMPDPSVFDISIPGKRNQELFDRYIFKKEMVFVMEWAVNQIPEEFRTIAAMLFLKNLKGREVAENIGISAASVSRQKQEILKQLIEHIRDYFIWKYRNVGEGFPSNFEYLVHLYKMYK